MIVMSSSVYRSAKGEASRSAFGDSACGKQIDFSGRSYALSMMVVSSVRIVTLA